jgi:hypothetical protein
MTMRMAFSDREADTHVISKLWYALAWLPTREYGLDASCVPQSIPIHSIEGEDFTMSNAKHTPKRKRGAKAVPVLGAAGLLSLAGGASAATGGSPLADLPTQKTAPTHEIILGEEELSDVSLSTFYVFNKESAKPQVEQQVAWWRGCGGCRCGGCRCGGCGWRRCGGCGCGGCGCCASWGRCRIC